MALKIARVDWETRTIDPADRNLILDRLILPASLRELVGKEIDGHLVMGMPIDATRYAEDLVLLNSRFRELGIESKDILMLPPVLLEKGHKTPHSSYNVLSHGFVVKEEEKNCPGVNIHEMTHAASHRVVAQSKSYPDQEMVVLQVGCRLSRNNRPIFSVLNEYAAVVSEMISAQREGKEVVVVKSKDSILSEEEKNDLLELTRTVDSGGTSGIMGKLKRLYKKATSFSGDFSINRIAIEQSNGWICRRTRVSYQHEVAAIEQLGLEIYAYKNSKHLKQLSIEEKIAAKDAFRDQVQRAALSGKMTEVTKSIRETFGREGLRFISELNVGSNFENSKLDVYYLILFMRAGDIKDQERKESVRNKIVDHFFETRKANSPTAATIT